MTEQKTRTAIPTDSFPDDMLWLGAMDVKMADEQFGVLMALMAGAEATSSPRAWHKNVKYRVLALYRWFDLQLGRTWEESARTRMPDG